MKPQSMEEKISYRLFFMGFVGLVCTAVLCLFVFHKAFREQAWTSLEHQADLVSAGYEQLSSPDQLSVFVNGDLRITLIAADGSVVFESATDQQMENHLSRPEIQQAMREGVGRNCRDSQTMGYETYYYAMLLPGGDILRVAQDSETIWSIYDAALPAIILSCILMMGAAALIAGLLLVNRSLLEQAAALRFSAIEANLAKVTITDNAIQAVNIALELTGNHGLSRQNPLERHYRNVLCGRVHTPQSDSAWLAAGNFVFQSQG